MHERNARHQHKPPPAETSNGPTRACSALPRPAIATGEATARQRRARGLASTRLTTSQDNKTTLEHCRGTAAPRDWQAMVGGG